MVRGPPSGGRLTMTGVCGCALPAPRPLENRLSLLSHWATLAALIVLLATFWIGRKFNGAF